MSLLDQPLPWMQLCRGMRRSKPHYKPALLLAALDVLDTGMDPAAVIPVEPLVARFEAIVNAAGLDGADRAAMPAWHLAIDSGTPHPFWSLVWRDGAASGGRGQPDTTEALVRRVAGVRLRAPLADTLRTPYERILARHAVYEVIECDRRPGIERLLGVHPEDEEAVRAAEDELTARLDEPFSLEDSEADAVTLTRRAISRDWAFRRVVLSVYEERCALCSQRIRSRGRVEVQAAHVMPRAQRGVNDVRNGMALCRTHHWAFDEFLWTVDADWSVRVRLARRGTDDDLDALARFERIAPPPDERERPHPLALAWHGKRFDEARKTA